MPASNELPLIRDPLAQRADLLGEASRHRLLVALEVRGRVELFAERTFQRFEFLAECGDIPVELFEFELVAAFEIGFGRVGREQLAIFPLAAFGRPAFRFGALRERLGGGTFGGCLRAFDTFDHDPLGVEDVVTELPSLRRQYVAVMQRAVGVMPAVTVVPVGGERCHACAEQQARCESNRNATHDRPPVDVRTALGCQHPVSGDFRQPSPNPLIWKAGIVQQPASGARV